MSILHLLSNNNFIAVNRTIASIVGLEAAAVLGEIASEYIYWQSNDQNFNGEFYSTIENLESRTFLSAHSQRLALMKLQEQGWIKVEKKGMPAKRYIRVFEDKIMEVVNDKSLKILTTSDEKSERQVVKNFNGNKNIYKENIEKELSKDISIYDEAMFDLLPDEPKKKRFVPPTVEEVAEYCKQRNNDIDAEEFVAWYGSRNWMSGKNKITNWKLCIITWEKKRQNNTKKANDQSGNPFINLAKKEGYL